MADENPEDLRRAALSVRRRRMTNSAPLHSLAIAFLLGLLLAKRALRSASLGDSAAKENLSAVLEDDRRAARELEDMRMALSLAISKLKEAEATHSAAAVAFRKAEVNRLARERVGAAADIDKAFADFSAAFERYRSLGLELFNVAADDHAGNIHSFSESVDGMLRLAAALPHQPFYDLRWRHSFAPIGTGPSSALAEATYWRLPTDAVRRHEFFRLHEGNAVMDDAAPGKSERARTYPPTAGGGDS
jgi:hypothetical protein